MAYFNPEPSYQHDVSHKVGILLINLGTPDAPTTSALRSYLKQFLNDRRIVEIPRAIWWIILNGIILNIRPKKSAEKYASIWTNQGPPLLLHAQSQTQLLRAKLSAKIKSPLSIELGMRYGNPSIQSAINKLKADHCDRILVFPLYPQYAASSTASALDAVWKVLLKTRNVPAIRTIKHYHDHPAYIAALVQNVQTYWQSKGGRPTKLIMSFHGVPKAHLTKGDPYFCECHKTARLVAQALELNEDQYTITFQSRFGKQEWLKPYLAGKLIALGKSKTQRVDIICPGFSSDCLETLEEIAIEGKRLFQSHGGGEFNYIPALNENEAWCHALAEIALENLQGWVSESWGLDVENASLKLTAARAKALTIND